MISGAVAAPGTSPVVGLAGSTGSTTFVLVVLLIALGVAMIVVAVWLVRATRSDAPALAPLEVMGDRGFSRAGHDDRDAKLTAVRPEGAPPPAPMIPYDEDDASVTASAPAEAPPSEAAVEHIEEDAAVGDDGSR